jgi:hypothetical protein
MGRPAERDATGKARKPKGKKQFNAALQEQLVLDFNTAAAAQGRDALLGELIYKFLEKARPDSPSVLELKAKRKTTSAAAHELEVQLDDDAISELEVIIEERRALARVKELAQELVEVTTAALMRRPPKQAAGVTSPRNRKRAAS